MDDNDADGEAVQSCRTLCRLCKDDGDEQVVRKLAASLAQRCSAFPKSESVASLWKQLDDRGTNLLQNLLSTVEKCEDPLLAVSLVRLLDMYVRRAAKGRKRRIRLVVALNGVTSILKCLLTFVQRPSADLETVEPLVYLVLLFGGVDKKFHLKVRLTGALKAAAEFSKNSQPVSLSVLDLLIAATQSAPNALFLGKTKDMIPHLFSVISTTMGKDTEICRKSLELVYYLAKQRKNRTRLSSSGGVVRMVDLFKCYFPSTDDSATKMCLIILGTLRLLTRTKSGQQELVGCNGLTVFRDAARVCLEWHERDKITPMSKELDAAICTVCLRCLPSTPFPIDSLDHSLKFPLPVDAERQPAEEQSDSEDEREPRVLSEEEEEVINVDEPLLKRERRKASDLEKDYGKLCTEFNPSALFPAMLLQPLRTVASFDQAGMMELMKKTATPKTSGSSSVAQTPATGGRLVSSKLPAVGQVRRRRSLSVGELYTRNSNPKSVSGRSRMRTDASHPKKLAPIAVGSRRLSLEELPKRRSLKSVDYTPEEFTKHAMETKSVVPFCKVAYPEFIGGYPNLPLQPLKNPSPALLRRVLQELDKFDTSSPFEQRVVFDVDELFATCPTRGRLWNDDRDRIGKPDPHCDHLKFESRFESGNLRKAVQIGPYEYELFLNSDINQLQHHFMWFYFEISNMEANVPYTFTISNCIKSQSLFQTGMQPVVFSVSEAEAGRPGWARCGRTVVYYRNRYTRPAKKSSDAKSFHSASFTVAFRHAYDVCYFAYHYPYTYSMLRTHLCKLQESLTTRHGIYARRDALCHTLGSNPVDLLTITATGKPNVVAKRDCVVLSSRVHPGEANSSWMMHGTLQFLLSDNPKAKEAREKYIFKIIPMLNPDGVINGNHRCSLAGQDLNRQWVKPSPQIHPTIYHTKGLLLYLHSISKAPFVYCDYHGHSRKKNIFLYGNNPQLSWWTPDHALLHKFDFYTLPEILDDVSPSFWLKYSSFAIQKEKEASARVAVWREMGVWRSYTMEASYGGFDRGPYQGYQIGTHQCIEMGEKFCEGLVQLKDQVLANQPPSRKFEESDEDSVALPPLVGNKAALN